ncbi:hypothetical protein [Polynucleobacter sp. MWH-UH25E]|uniref:hypothetical protein n=1 Tax=Polynucleobacter sp. MWH-UH25E TaxID=1855616 RepID=UPI001BFD990A|nr:hypothetical protein [Polynucleobacter sp. MWH-UH25E]QWD62975.1 hypothetical protein ICV39_05050 [Polynucleobacter sp. MWH-UH25E]
MNVDLVKYLSAVIRGNLSDPSVTCLGMTQQADDEKGRDPAKDLFLVDSRYSLALDEII